jgi:hypothetical protein
LLYGTLAEAGTYMKSAPEDGMYKVYQERYVQAIALLKNLGDGSNVQMLIAMVNIGLQSHE